MNRWLIAAGAVAAGWGAIEGTKRLAFVVAVPVALAFASAGDMHGVALAAWVALVALCTMASRTVRPYLIAVALVGTGVAGFVLWPREPGPTIDQVQGELAVAHGALAAARAQHQEELTAARERHREELTAAREQHERELAQAQARHVEEVLVLIADVQAQAREERARLQSQHREELAAATRQLAQAQSELAREQSNRATRAEHVEREVVRYAPASQAAPAAGNRELCAALASARKEYLNRISRAMPAHGSLHETEARMRAAGCPAIG